MKQGQYPEAQRLLRDNPGAFYKMDQINKTINEQNKTVRSIYQNPSIPADEKRQLIDGIYYQMIQLAKFGNQEVEQINKKMQAR
jgi:hypothetical protein